MVIAASLNYWSEARGKLAPWQDQVIQFVKKTSEIARGKAYFTSTVTLGQYIMMDFLKGKRKRVG